MEQIQDFFQKQLVFILYRKWHWFFIYFFRFFILLIFIYFTNIWFNFLFSYYSSRISKISVDIFDISFFLIQFYILGQHIAISPTIVQIPFRKYQRDRQKSIPMLFALGNIVMLLLQLEERFIFNIWSSHHWKYMKT